MNIQSIGPHPRMRMLVRFGIPDGAIVTSTAVGKSQRTTGAIRTLLKSTQVEEVSREHVKGTAEKAKGTVKQGAGKLSGDKELEREGQADKAKGDVHKTAGNVKDAALEARSQLAAFVVGTVAALKRARAAPRSCQA